MELSVQLYFDLDDGRFRIKDITDYSDLANLAGVFTLKDPNLNILHQNVDFNNPDIDHDVSLFSAYQSFTIVEGEYILSYSVHDFNTGETYQKDFIFTYDANIPTIKINIESDIGLGIISSTDETEYTDTVTLNSRIHKLVYPASWGQTETTENTISLTELYTGRYVGYVTSDITINKPDNLIINVTIEGSKIHDVWDSDGFYVIKAALNNFYDLWQTNQTANPKEARRQESIWIEICANYSLYNSYKQNGDIENAGNYLHNIKTLLAAENIDTTIDPSVSVPVTAILPGYATQWLNGIGVPSPFDGRNGDFYIDTSTNKYYKKEDGSWNEIGTVGANTLIQFGDGVTWYDDYIDGRNYIRYSGDGGVTWSTPAKFIDGYTYVAYASDENGTDFICTDDPAFVMDNSLEYRAEKKFPSSHNGDLTANDFAGLFVRYKGEGFSISASNIEVPYDVNTKTYDYTSAKSQIIITRGEDDLTADFTYTKSIENNVTATVDAGLVTITGMTDQNGYVDIIAQKSGVADLTIRIYVLRMNSGENSYSIMANPGTISVITDADGNNPEYVNVDSEIKVFWGHQEDTWNFDYQFESKINVDGILTDNILTVTSITADTGYFVLAASKIGIDILITIYVKKVKKGQAVVDSTSVDNETIELNVSNQLAVKDRGISENNLDNILFNGYVLRNSYDVGVFSDIGWLMPFNIANINYDLFSLVFPDPTSPSGSYCKLLSYKYNSNTNQITLMGEQVDAFPVSVRAKTYNLTENTIVVLRSYLTDPDTNRLEAWTFDGSVWNKGTTLYDGDDTIFTDICKINDKTIALAIGDRTVDYKLAIRIYTWDNGVFSQVGSDFDLSNQILFSTAYKIRLVTLDTNKFLVDYVEGTSSYLKSRKILSFDGLNVNIDATLINQESVVSQQLNYEFFGYKKNIFFYREDESNDIDLWTINNGTLFKKQAIYTKTNPWPAQLLSGEIVVAHTNNDLCTIDVISKNNIY
jgi:hypothetical protein